MSSEFTFRYPKYLAAKKSIDDKALNRHVFETLKRNSPEQSKEKPLKIIEIGAGIGTMIERLIEWDFLRYAHYTAIDINEENVLALPQRLANFADEPGLTFETTGENSNELVLRNQKSKIKITPVCSDFREFLDDASHQHHWDLVIAHAVLDILPLNESLEHILAGLQQRGLFWFTLNYNGVTRFEPTIDPDLDRSVEQLYNRSMDRRKIQTGGSQTGQKLFSAIPTSGGEILAAGSSDWVLSTSDSEFIADEQYFLRCILQMVYESVSGTKELSSAKLDDWRQQRLHQIQEGSLTYIAHQLDFCGNKR